MFELSYPIHIHQPEFHLDETFLYSSHVHSSTLHHPLDKDYIIQNPKYLRPEELPYLRGDSTKIRTELGWEPEYSFEDLMDDMIDHWLKIYEK